MQRICVIVLVCLTSITAAIADQVTPTGTGVNIREFPSSEDTAVLGRLRSGERAEILESVPYWYKIGIPSGGQGFVSKRYVQVIPSNAVATSKTSIPFIFHVVDVGIGDGLILDMGDREIVVDGGMAFSYFKQYITSNQLIKDPIELAIVTHADSDHWRGMGALLNLQAATPAYHVSEFWEPGYDRPCSVLESYDNFINGMKRLVPVTGFKRPLQTTQIPSSISGALEPIELSSLPGVKITVLHAEVQPAGPNCAYRINNASLVLRVEVGGIVMLWTGHTNGKLREESADVSPEFIEEKLLAVERQHPGTLKADVLKVAHHGSETSSTSAFINAVKPKFAIISASTNHSLPREPVVRRYEDAGDIVLRTDKSRTAGNDHVVCVGSGDGNVDCNYADLVD